MALLEEFHSAATDGEDTRVVQNDTEGRVGCRRGNCRRPRPDRRAGSVADAYLHERTSGLGKIDTVKVRVARGEEGFKVDGRNETRVILRRRAPPRAVARAGNGGDVLDKMRSKPIVVARHAVTREMPQLVLRLLRLLIRVPAFRDWYLGVRHTVDEAAELAELVITEVGL